MKKLLTIWALLMTAICLGACGGLPDDEVDVTLNDIIEANSLEALLDEYDNVLVQEDVVNINGFVEDTSYHYFAMEDGQLVGDVWHADEEYSMVINARNGAIYGLMGSNMNVAVIPEADYWAMVEKLYPLLPDLQAEEIQSVTVVKEENEILVTTVRDTFPDGSVSLGAEYRLNADTLEIESVQIISYNEKGQKSRIIGLTVEYDSKVDPDVSAWNSVTQPSDGGFCNVTAVIQPGSDDEEVRKIQVAHASSVEVTGKSSYNLYSDENCHILMPMADTDADSITIYAKAVE